MVTIALDVPPGSLAVMCRAAGLARPRAEAASFAWYPPPDADTGTLLVAAGRGRGRMARVVPVQGAAADGALCWPEGVAAPPEDAAPLCRFTGRRRAIVAGQVRLCLLEGRLVAGDAAGDVARAVLVGPGAAVAEMARAWPGARVAASSLSARALAGLAAPDPPAPLPLLAPELTVSAAVGLTCGHIAGLLEALRPGAIAGEGPEFVHQMRVAVRRLRSALRLVRRSLPSPVIPALSARLRSLGHALAPARDWDVFLAGLGAEVVAALPEERAIARLMAAAERRRAAAYADLRLHLEGEACRLLLLDLGLAEICPPWEAGGLGVQGLADFAAAALARQWRRLMAPGRSLDGLPEARLHAIRIEAKRMRYAAELFLPLFPRRETTRMIARLRVVQDLLGHLNDGATARELLAQLGPAGQGFAGGAVHGYVAAAGGAQRAQIDAAWRRLRKLDIFWI